MFKLGFQSVARTLILTSGTALRPAFTKSLLNRPLVRFYSDLDPANKKDYDVFVNQWLSHFKTVDDDFELERGLNHIFAADWVPAVEVIAEALHASRRLNTFATAVRILEALEEKAYKKEQYDQYIRELKPILDEYGVVEKKELGEFLPFRDRNPREE
jgi:cytochrome c oxidase subunit 5a